MPAPKGYLRKELTKVILEWARMEGTDFSSGLRDALTDMRHIAAEHSLDFALLDCRAANVYEEELYEEEAD